MSDSWPEDAPLSWPWLVAGVVVLILCIFGVVVAFRDGPSWSTGLIFASVNVNASTYRFPFRC